jgi:hypothetical protein
MNSQEKLEWEIRQTPLHLRIDQSIKMIGDMCADGRPPYMSIPVRPTDEDEFIVTTLKDALEAIRYYASRMPEIDMNPHIQIPRIDGIDG